MSFFRQYNHLVKTRPLATNIATTGVLFGTGDVMAQAMEKKPYDSKRTLRAAAYGAAIFAPMADKWFKFLSTVQVGKSAAVNTVARVALDQGFFAPCVGIPLYFSVMTWMEAVMNGEGEIVDKVRKKLNGSYYDTLQSNWAVWPAVQAVNFALVPVGLRLLVVNVVSIGWNCFLSLQMNGGRDFVIID